MLHVDRVDFWETLVEGRTVQSIVPRQRWDMDAFYDPDGGSGKMYTRIAATIQVLSTFHTHVRVLVLSIVALCQAHFVGCSAALPASTWQPHRCFSSHVPVHNTGWLRSAKLLSVDLACAGTVCICSASIIPAGWNMHSP